MESLDQMIQMEEERNKLLPWNKLDKSLKIRKIMEYSAEFAQTNNMTEDKANELKTLLRDKIQRKELFKKKDVVYDAATGKIKHLPALSHHEGEIFFKAVDRASPLNSLAPKNKTVKKDIKIKAES
jgi:hypothetical protein